jgi:hypothetical protein
VIDDLEALEAGVLGAARLVAGTEIMRQYNQLQAPL